VFAEKALSEPLRFLAEKGGKGIILASLGKVNGFAQKEKEKCGRGLPEG